MRLSWTVSISAACGMLGVELYGVADQQLFVMVAVRGFGPWFCCLCHVGCHDVTYALHVTPRPTIHVYLTFGPVCQ